MAWPAACFLAGCAISYAVTLRYQWQEGGYGSSGYLSAYYYQGKLDAHSIFEFSIYGIWSLLTYHLPWIVAIAALTAGALLLAAALLGKFQGKFPDRAVAVLFSLCLAISVGAAVLGIYPLGGIRQVIYLGPIVFLSAGLAFHGAAGGLAGLTRRGWPAPAPAVVAAGAIALAGVGDIRQDSPYQTKNNEKSVFAFLEERVREDDLVYAERYVTQSLRFYQEKEERPANYYSNYYYSAHRYWGLNESFLQYLSDLLVLSLPDLPNRIFLVHDSESMKSIKGLELLGEQVSVEHFLTDGNYNISLITYAKESLEAAAQALVSGGPVIRSDWDVYLTENSLGYVKEPCAPADTEATFFLHLHPVDANALPDYRKQYGFDNLDFKFDKRDGGVIFDGKCMTRISLPEYAVAHIRTGQFVPVEGGYNHLWEGEISLER